MSPPLPATQILGSEDVSQIFPGMGQTSARLSQVLRSGKTLTEPVPEQLPSSTQWPLSATDAGAVGSEQTEPEHHPLSQVASSASVSPPQGWPRERPPPPPPLEQTLGSLVVSQV